MCYYQSLLKWSTCLLILENLRMIGNVGLLILSWRNLGRDPFNQNFRKFRSKTQWIGLIQPEKFRKNGSTFWGGPLFPVGPVGILVDWIAPMDWICCTKITDQLITYNTYPSWLKKSFVFIQVYDHMVSNTIFPALQSSYRQFHSTETELIKVMNDILLKMNSQHVTMLILLDLSAAFDTVDHRIVLEAIWRGWHTWDCSELV